jgi:predicted deacylase
MASRSQIFTDVDYEMDGKQVGWLYVPHSVTRSAYGHIAIPIAIIKNRSGPTVFFMAGNHGDEYEGQVALCKLIRALEPGEVSGRVIVMPAANLPAALAGTRVSPIDQGNLNRAFPGDPEGSPTRMIAHYVDSVLFPISELFQDLHSGGSSLGYLPFAASWKSGDPTLDAKALAAVRAFGAPVGLVWAYGVGSGLAATSAIHRGVVALGGEFGGGGSVSVSGMRMVETGLRNLLAHAGVIEPPPETERDRASMRLFEVRGCDYFVVAPEAGLFQPFVELGEKVQTGQPCGQVHFVDDPRREPVQASFRTAGIVVCKRSIGRVQRGDVVAHLATDYRE